VEHIHIHLFILEKISKNKYLKKKISFDFIKFLRINEPLEIGEIKELKKEIEILKKRTEEQETLISEGRKAEEIRIKMDEEQKQLIKDTERKLLEEEKEKKEKKKKEKDKTIKEKEEKEKLNKKIKESEKLEKEIKKKKTK
jgi:hypothetical protein